MREGEELKAPYHASAAASCDDSLPHSQHFIFYSFIKAITEAIYRWFHFLSTASI